MKTPTPYPISSTSQIAAHFSGLQAEPPAHLVEAWHALVLRRMAGQDVDDECAALLQQERDHNRRGVPAMPRWKPSHDAGDITAAVAVTVAKRPQFKSWREPIGTGGRGSVPDQEDV
jgi:hypothetical protein